MKKIYYYIIGAILCFYGLNNYIDVCICIFLSVFILMHIKDNNSDYLYFGLLFFEPILVIPFLEGTSFFRVYQLIYIIKIIYEITHKKAIINIKNICTFSAIFLIFTGVLYQSFSEEISLIINVLIMTYIICKKRDTSNFNEELLYVLGTLITFSAIYGFFRGIALSYGSYTRLSTTISDPNYSALFINIGIFSIINNNIFNKKEKILLLGILGIALVLTVSQTGIIGCLVILLLYSLLKNSYKFLKYLISILVILIIFMCIPIKQGNILFGIHERLLNIQNASADEISSGRVSIALDYIEKFNELSLKEFLIGGNNTISGEFRDKMVEKVSTVSHNSYIDMLYMIGIVGVTIFIFTYVFSMYKLIKEYKRGNMIAINYLLLKIVLLYFAFTISIFPFRYFLAIYLLTILEKKKNDESIKEYKDNMAFSLKKVEL